MDQVKSRKVLSDYKHNVGRNCASASWSGILKYQGYDIDQTDLVGIGNGLIFLYQAIPKVKFFNMIILSSDIIPDFLTNTGIGGIVRTYRDNNHALEQILKSLDQGIPVAAELNPQHCENLSNHVDSAYYDYLFKHWITIIGYDLKKNVLILHDNALPKSFEISIDDFKKGRNTGNYTQNPKNFFYSITYPDLLYPKKASMLLSLKKTTFKFLYVKKFRDSSAYCGRYGYEKAIRQIPIWNKIMDQKTLLDRLSILKNSLLLAGLAKGAYRYTFAEYLVKCASVLEMRGLIETSKIFKESGHLWRDFIKTLDKVMADVTNPIFWGKDSLLAEKLSEIYHLELKGFELLDETINT